MWAAVAAAVLFTVYNFREAQSTSEAIRQTRAALDQQVELQKKSAQDLALARREALILTDPRSIRIDAPEAKACLPGVHATWHTALGILISGEKLPIPGGNRTLQLWLLPKTAGAKPVPSLAVRPDSNGRLHLLVANPPNSVRDTRALAITEEPEGGSLQPTALPIWTCSINDQGK
jgi:hypothetical protein